MACKKYIEAIFGENLISAKIIEMREKDLLKNLSDRANKFYDKFGCMNNQEKFNKVKIVMAVAQSIYSEDRIPKDNHKEMYISTRCYWISQHAYTMTRDEFVSFYTSCDDMTFVDKLKINRAFMIYLDYADMME